MSEISPLALLYFKSKGTDSPFKPGLESLFLSCERVLAFSVFRFCDQPHTILFVFIECGNSDKLGSVAVGPIPILLSGSDWLDFHFDSFNLWRFHFTTRGRARNYCGGDIGDCGRSGAILDLKFPVSGSSQVTERVCHGSIVFRLDTTRNPPIFPGLASQSLSGTIRVVDVVAGKAENEKRFFHHDTFSHSIMTAL